jgi:hypothetical protein
MPRKNYFIMTIRHPAKGRQLKITVENNVCYEREYRLYPFSDILTMEKILTYDQLVAVVATNLAIQAAEVSVANIYINGDNYRRFTGL